MTIADFEKAHTKDDTDFEPGSKHHTLGPGPNQAAQGTHNHDTKYTPYTARMPIGSIIMWPNGTILPGQAEDGIWLECIGGTFLGSDFPDLRNILGDTFGAHVGDAYKLPDFRNKFPLGQDIGVKDTGTTGGADTAALAVANLPPHTHSIAHAHTTNSRTTATGFGTSPTAAQPTATGVAGTLSTSGSDTGQSGNGSGTSTPVGIKNPYLAITFIIKAL